MPKKPTKRPPLPRWLQTIKKGQVPHPSDLPRGARDEERSHRNPPGRCYVCGSPAPDFPKRWLDIGAGREQVRVCEAHKDVGDEYYAPM